MREEIIKLISEILEITEEQLVANLDSKEVWDSLKRVEIFFAIEDEFSISFSENMMAKLDTPEKLLNEIR